MADIFDNPIASLVPIANTATDADSPNTALLLDKIRVFLEGLLGGLYGYFETGTLTSNPPNDTTGYAYDTAAGFIDDEHNNRRIIFTDGLALGQDFLIDDTSAGSNAVICTGDNLYSAGARSGDGYIIIGNFRNALGHIHDGQNARNFIPYRSSCGSGDTVFSTNVTTATYDSVTNQRVYVPADTQNIIFSAKLRNEDGSTITYARTKIGTDYGAPVLSNTGTTSTWKDGSTIDVSGYSPGYYTVEIQLATQTGIYAAYLDAFNLFIE